MTATPDCEPARIQAGDTIRWTRTLVDYPPADGWTLSYVFVGPEKRTVTASDDGERYQVAIDASDSAAWKAGEYIRQALVTKGDERHTLATDRVLVLADVSQEDAGYDGRSHARTVLDAIEATIEGRAGAAENATTINGRSIQYIPIDELLKLRDRYRAMVRAEENADKASGDLSSRFGKILTRFGP